MAFKDEESFLKRKFGCSLTGLCSCIVDSCCKNLFGSHDAGPMLLLCWWMPTEATRTDECNMYTAKKNATQNFSCCRKYMAFRLCKCKKTNINNYRKNRNTNKYKHLEEQTYVNLAIVTVTSSYLYIQAFQIDASVVSFTARNQSRARTQRH